ncbi:hypothetical protein BMIN_1635 [Bifidobacterium minimum]|uniref:Uncharacterized protein n=1 Tax=Bifidobacterium minimum TaxID=1693 RepID=A0A087BIW0_9BIFI|nr:hypothetical protein BMIN_1635 [Bifidobacterium minimum]
MNCHNCSLEIHGSISLDSIKSLCQVVESLYLHRRQNIPASDHQTWPRNSNWYHVWRRAWACRRIDIVIRWKSSERVLWLRLHHILCLRAKTAMSRCIYTLPMLSRIRFWTIPGRLAQASRWKRSRPVFRFPGRSPARPLGF